MILAAVIIFGAALLQGLSGFGYALVATPLFTFIFGAKSAVMMVILLGVFNDIMILVSWRRHIETRRLIFMSIGAVLGVPLGAYGLSRLDPVVLKIVIASVAVPFAVLLILGRSHHFKRDNIGCVGAGFLSGLFGASTSFSGPPVALFLLSQGLRKEKFVGTLAAYFLIIDLVSIAALSSFSLLTSELLINSALLLPALLLGVFVGTKLLPKIDSNVFRWVAASVVCVAALSLIITIFIKL